MMLNLPELILIFIIVLLVFGLGKLGDISHAVARLRMNFHKGLGEDAVDITASQKNGAEAPRELGPKPGTRPQPVEDAEIEERPPSKS